MRKLTCIILLSCLLGMGNIFAQKLVLSPFGMCSSDSLSVPYVEYSYRQGVGQKDLKDYCIQKLSQPDFFSYRVDYTDDKTIKLSGFIRKSLKGERFNLLFEFGQQSVRVSSKIYNRDGTDMDCQKKFTKKGRVKDIKLKSMVETKINEIIRSMMDMKIVIR